MISDFFINFFGGIFDWAFAGVPEVQVPDWLNSAASMGGTVFGYANSMGVWFPSALAMTVAGTLVATWLISSGIHIARMVISHFTGGGGAV